MEEYTELYRPLLDFSLAEEPDARVCSQAACSRREPQSPLIQGLLRRIKALPSLDGLEDPDLEAVAELKGVTPTLIDGALVRSGPEITNSNVYVFLVFACAVCTNCTELTASLNASTVLSVALLVCPRRPKPL